MDYEQKLKFGEEEYEITVGFNSHSTINFYNNNGDRVLSLQPSELIMLVAGYKEFLEYDHIREIREVEFQQTRSKNRI